MKLQTRHPAPPPSIRGRRRGVGAVVPLVRRRVVHLHRVEELVAVEAAHGVDGFAEYGQACIAAGRRHAAQHLPFVAGGVVHFHAAEGVGAIETADNKQFAWTEGDRLDHLGKAAKQKKKNASLGCFIVKLTCVDSNTGPPAGHIHGGYEGPSVVLRVVTFHRVQAVPGLCSSSHIHEALQLAHCCLMPPCGRKKSINAAPTPISRGNNLIQKCRRVLMLREAQLDQVLVTGSKTSQFFKPFCPQGSDPPTT